MSEREIAKVFVICQGQRYSPADKLNEAVKTLFGGKSL